MKMSTIAIGLLSAAVLCGRASAAETYYGAAANAVPLQQAGGTARAMAMGSALIAVPDGSGSLLMNPAGLSQMPCKELGLHSNTGLGGIVQEVAVYGMPLGKMKDDCSGGSWGGIAASLGYVDYGTFNGATAAGVQTGNYGNTGDITGSLGWGKEILPGLSGGFSLKEDRTSVANTSYDALTADAGVLWKVLDTVDLGLVYSNLNLGNAVGAMQPAAGWRLGAGWNATKHWLLSASGELQHAALQRMEMGTEYLVGDLEKKSNVFALRAGYVVNYPSPQLTGMTGMTFGLGYTVTKALAVDWAMLPMGALGNSQRLSLTFKFGCPVKKKAVIVAVVPAAVVVAAPVKAAPAEASLPIVLTSVELNDQHFDFDQSTLKPSGMAALRDNIRLLKENPTSKVRVAGYTSMSGTAEYNQKLSERRAAAVRDFLVANGVAPNRIATIGFGENRPAVYEANVKDINSAAAKSNMRVLFEMTVQ